jgi:hypothetical protein
MHVKYRQNNFALYDMVHCYVRDNSYGLTIHVNFMVKCVCYMGLGSNGCFMAVLDSIVPLVLCTIAYNIRGTSVVLQVFWDSVNPAGNG